jgi:hypothetical protein
MINREDVQHCDFRVFRVNPGDSGKKSGYSGQSGVSGFLNPGVSGFRPGNPNSQCCRNHPSKPRNIADLEPMECSLPIP